MKNPNGFGTVVKLSGNRRRPWAVREGKTGRQRTIGYAETKEEGLILLAKYNQNPWDIDAAGITFAEVFDEWCKRKGPKMNQRTFGAIKSAYIHCTYLYNMKYRAIRTHHMQFCIDNCPRSYGVKNTIKTLFYHLDRMAFEMDIIDKMYSQMTESEPVPNTTKKVFTDEEISRLWANQGLETADTALFLLYTGFRIGEMADIRIENVDTEQGTITGGNKTAAGKNRIVPIHSYIKDIVEKRMQESEAGYLFEMWGHKIKINSYRKKWIALMEQLDMNHTPHECRHTFRTMLDSAGANPICIDRIMGHRSPGVGERIYTHKTVEELKANIELVTKK